MASAHRTAAGAALKSLLAVLALGCSAPAAPHPVDRWAGEIALASARFGIPAEWIRRVMRVESGGRTMLHGQPILSRAGAMGLMQLMPSTWLDMRALLGLGANPNDAHDNILAGTAYLRMMYDRFGYPGLFAAYNAGPVRYAAVLSGARRLPTETRAYVASVTRGAALATGRRAASPSSVFALNVGGLAAPMIGERVAAGPAGTLFVELGRGAGH